MIRLHGFHFIWVLVLSLFVTGCEPTANFNVTPTAVVAGQEATFDASTSLPSSVKTEEKITSYDWKFGDGATATGKIAKHTFATQGRYKVTLKVTYGKGHTNSLSQTIAVAAPLGAKTDVLVLVAGQDGAFIKDATVTISGVTGVSDGAGIASLSKVTAEADAVMNVSKAGYITQSQTIKLAKATGQQIAATLKLAAEAKPVANIAAAQTVTASFGAKVNLPAQAFVIAGTTTPATGAATLQLTPWSIKNTDLAATLGNGRAKTAAGTLVDLISAGMMTVDFVDANGKKLQLAMGKTATIEMNLLSASINNQVLGVGSTIPLWHFDEAQGLWIEEGKGMVVASATSPTGLAITATVKHFSTWDWGLQIENTGSVFVKCVDAAGAAVPCNVTAQATLFDGSVLNTSYQIPAEGLTVINMPIVATVFWKVRTLTGMVVDMATFLEGAVTSGATGNVTITVLETAYNLNSSVINLMCNPIITDQANPGLTYIADTCDIRGAFYNADGSFTYINNQTVAAGALISIPANVLSFGVEVVADSHSTAILDGQSSVGSKFIYAPYTNVVIDLKTEIRIPCTVDCG
ncbi:MAG: PKD domain-containing protein [Burkholderiaceae bacterium]|nr:PKD domain-containing protein [Burkholderiaceae bacterium]